MVLVNCPECDKEISDKALMCPNCGFSGGNVQDPQAIEFFKRFLGSWVEHFQKAT